VPAARARPGNPGRCSSALTGCVRDLAPSVQLLRLDDQDLERSAVLHYGEHGLPRSDHPVDEPVEATAVGEVPPGGPARLKPRRSPRPSHTAKHERRRGEPARSRREKGVAMATTNRLETATAASRRTIASYSTYAEAERAVDWLADDGFAVERSAIVGTGLRSVEIGRERARPAPRSCRRASVRRSTPRRPLGTRASLHIRRRRSAAFPSWR